MNFWIDAQLPPNLADWIVETFGINAISLRDLGLQNAKDTEIFNTARIRESIVIVTKDSDFVDLVIRLGKPPQILWVTCGNVTNRNLRELFQKTFPSALQLLQAGEMIVEISDQK